MPSKFRHSLHHLPAIQATIILAQLARKRGDTQAHGYYVRTWGALLERMVQRVTPHNGDANGTPRALARNVSE